MLYPDLYESTIAPKNKLEKDLYSCDGGDDACVVAYVSKMFATPAADLPENKKKPLTADEMRAKAREAKEARQRALGNGEDGQPAPDGSAPLLALSPETNTDVDPAGDFIDADEVLLGFARLYSGSLRVGSRIGCVLPKYNNGLGRSHGRNKSHYVETKVEGLYTMMGRDLVAVERVDAGNVFAIKGLEGKVWRSATLCSPRASGIQESDSEEDWLINLGSINLQVSARHVLPKSPKF